MKFRLQIWLNRILVPALLLLVSIQVKCQEQLTHFKGDPCCYNVRELVTFDEHTFAISRDHQEGVKIYELMGDEAMLKFSNHDDDKNDLLIQGQIKEGYFLIYRTHLVVFDFGLAAASEYEFPDPLDELPTGDHGAIQMTKYGLLIFPVSQSDSIQFFNLATQEFEALTNSADRTKYKQFVDSFMFITNAQGDNTALLSHNIITDEVRKLYTEKAMDFDFKAGREVLYFRFDHEVFMTKGRHANTHFLFKRDSTQAKIHFEEGAGRISFLSSGNHSNIQLRSFNTAGHSLDSFELPFEKSHFISKFNLTAGNEVVFDNRYDRLYATDRAEREIIKIDDFSQFTYLVDSNRVYYLLEDEFWSFDTETQLKSRLYQGLSLDIIYQMEVAGDHSFYLRGHFSGEAQNVYFLDVERNTLKEMILLGENGSGLDEGNLEYTTSSLFLAANNEFPTHVLNNDQFEKINSIAPTSHFINHKGQDLIIGQNNTLYEWDAGNSFQELISGFPSPAGAAFYKLSESGDALFAYTDDKLLLLNVENENFQSLLPFVEAQLDQALYIGSEPYIIYQLLNASDEEEIWRYDVNADEWMKMFENKDFSSTELTILGDYFFWITKSGVQVKLNSMHLATGEWQTLTDFEPTSAEGRAVFFAKCDEEVFVHYRSVLDGEHRLWVTDGTMSGSRLLSDASPGEGYQIPYEFEGALYFTAVDSFNTKIYTYECGEGTLIEENWSRKLIAQEQFRLGEDRFFIGNSRFLPQRLTVAALYDNDVEEIMVSPRVFGFAGSRYDGSILRAVPTLQLNDTSMAIVADFDESREELWLLNEYQNMHRPFDLNEGPFSSFISDLTQYGNYLYFIGYQYGPGRQVWRYPLDSVSTTDTKTEKGNTFTLSPNPVYSHLQIENLPLAECRIAVYTSDGSKIAETVKVAGVDTYQLNADNYPAGIYFIRVMFKGTVQSDVFVKMD